MKIYYTKHAREILEERKIDKEIVDKLLRNPQQIINTKGDIEIAQGIFKRFGKDFLLRVVYKREGETIKVITAYWTSKIEKYWEDENEDKI
jgi:hypothetical protein